MIMSVYLHDEIASVLRCYGSLDDVINKVLDAASDGEFDFEDKPEAPARDGARRYDVDVKNDEYIELHRMFRNSPKISLRRLLYWFVENEMYEVLGWEVVAEYIDRMEQKRKKLAAKARQDLESLRSVVKGDSYDIVMQAINLISSLEV